MPKDSEKCRRYIARITYRAAKRAAARETWVKIRNINRQYRHQNRFQTLPTTLMGVMPQAIRTFGNPFAGKWPRRSDGAARTERLYQRRYAGGVA